MKVTIESAGSRVVLEVDDLPAPAKAAICRAVGLPVEAFDWTILVKFFFEKVVPILIEWFKNRTTPNNDGELVAP